ncbi:MAG: N-formylglutamate amidohydrolase [Albidovulum sp.]|nr:N-formylglutamate amidohydrolase [Albidovulum sp.]
MTSQRVPVFEYFEAKDNCSVLLTCEHAGRRIPPELNGLGLSKDEINRHIGWDIGAEAVCRELRAATGAALFIGRFSRLVVDLNRPANSPECVIGVSDGTEIPGNLGLSEREREDRIREFHRPFHEKLAEVVDETRPSAILPIHTFTPVLNSDGVKRPWHCAVLYLEAAALGKRCIRFLKSYDDILVGENIPYRIEPKRDFTVPVHGDRRGIPSVLMEIRQDLVESADGQRRWAKKLAEMMRACLPSDLG